MQNKKTDISIESYKKIIFVILVYILSGTLCEAYSIITKKEISLINILIDFFSFKAAPYAWYIEMYIGLFMIIPFMNILWNSLSREKRVFLVCVCTILTCLPSILSIWNFSNINWWQADNNIFTQIGMNYWEPLYPITYYFIGAYLSEYSTEVNKKIPAFVLPLAIIVLGLLNYFKNIGIKFPWNYDTDYSGYQCTVVSTILFVKLLYTRKLSRLKMISLLSKYSLGMYLTSYIADCVVYHFYNRIFVSYDMRLIFMPVAICIVITASLAMSYFITNIASFLYRKI